MITSTSDRLPVGVIQVKCQGRTQRFNLIEALPAVERLALATALLAGTGRVVVDDPKALWEEIQHFAATETAATISPILEESSQMWEWRELSEIKIRALLGLDRPEDEDPERVIVRAMLEEGS